MDEDEQLSFDFQRPLYVGVDFGAEPDITVMQFFEVGDDGRFHLVKSEELEAPKS